MIQKVLSLNQKIFLLKFIFLVIKSGGNTPAITIYRKLLGGPPICMEEERQDRKRVDETVHLLIMQPLVQWQDYPGLCSQMDGMPGMPKTIAFYQLYKQMIINSSMH